MTMKEYMGYMQKPRIKYSTFNNIIMTLAPYSYQAYKLGRMFPTLSATHPHKWHEILQIISKKPVQIKKHIVKCSAMWSCLSILI